jgi:hypothetical protein
MPDDNSLDRPQVARKAPETVATTNRINLALPFSRIETHEPSKELAELASIVATLAEIVNRLEPGDASDALRERARTLAAHLD